MRACADILSAKPFCLVTVFTIAEYPAAAVADKGNDKSNYLEALISIYLSLLGKSMKAGGMTVNTEGNDVIITIKYSKK